MKMCHFESRHCASRENVCRTVCQDEVWAPCAAKLQMVIYRNRLWQQNHYYSDALMMIGLKQVWVWSKNVIQRTAHGCLQHFICAVIQESGFSFKNEVFIEVLCSLNVTGPYGWRFSLDSCLSGDRWVHSQVLGCACKPPVLEPNEAVTSSFYVYSLLCFSQCCVVKPVFDGYHVQFIHVTKH